MNRFFVFGLTVPLLSAACGFADKGAVESLPGSYSSESAWDLGGPFLANQTMSENLADLFVSNVISSLGAPSSVQGELENAVSDVIRADLAQMIEAELPEEINSNSTLLSRLILHRFMLSLMLSSPTRKMISWGLIESWEKRPSIILFWILLLERLIFPSQILLSLKKSL
jgi:hypothetical protein